LSLLAGRDPIDVSRALAGSLVHAGQSRYEARRYGGGWRIAEAVDDRLSAWHGDRSCCCDWPCACRKIIRAAQEGFRSSDQGCAR
jgi:hypothetical protein